MVFYAALLVLIIPLFGQLGRFSFGSGGILLLDMILPIVILFWLFFKKKQIREYPLFFPLLGVLFIFFASLSYNIFWIDSWKDAAEGLFYFIRYTSIVAFSALVYDIIKQKNDPTMIQKYIFFLGGIAVCLAVLGFLQLWLYADFAKMAEKGWDPHIGRLLSTWFDPNFLGSFFSYVLIILISVVAMQWKRLGIKIISHLSSKILVLGIFILLIALLFTYSRSALLAFILPVSIVGILYFRTLFVVGCIAITLVLPFSPRATERISDGISSAFSVTQSNSMFIPDATARLRIENFQEGVALASNYFFTGVGFNLIRVHKTENIHSAGGFDSSLLTVFVASGVFGFFAFLFLHFFAMIQVLKKHISNATEHDSFAKGLQIGIIANMVGVFAQSFFINSLFFPFFILYFWSSIAVLLSQKNKEKQ